MHMHIDEHSTRDLIHALRTLHNIADEHTGRLTAHIKGYLIRGMRAHTTDGQFNELLSNINLDLIALEIAAQTQDLTTATELAKQRGKQIARNL